MKKEILKIIEIIPFKTFREKIELTKKYKNCKLQIIGNSLYVEKTEVEADE